MIKKILGTALFGALLIPSLVSCSSDDEVLAPVYEEVNYVSLNGTWRLSEWKGQPVGTQASDPYVYITFNRREHTFEMYENTGSMYSHKTTGTFEVTVDDDERTVLTGQYDFSGVEWGDYIVTEMTSSSMKWTRADDSADVSVYVRADSVPSDIVAGNRAIPSVR